MWVSAVISRASSVKLPYLVCKQIGQHSMHLASLFILQMQLAVVQCGL